MALETLRDRSHQFDLVLSDVYMPGNLPNFFSIIVICTFLKKEEQNKCVSLFVSRLQTFIQGCLEFPCLSFVADMDGFKLLEHIGLELDLPVISEFNSPLLRSLRLKLNNIIRCKARIY